MHRRIRQWPFGRWCTIQCRIIEGSWPAPADWAENVRHRLLAAVGTDLDWLGYHAPCYSWLEDLPDVCEHKIHERLSRSPPLYTCTTKGFSRNAYGVKLLSKSMIQAKNLLRMGSYCRGLRTSLLKMRCRTRGSIGASRTASTTKRNSSEQ